MVTVIDATGVPVAGSDGVTPVYDPNSRWSVWAYQEIWFGKTGKNKYVPKVNDYVVDYETNIWYIVVSLNTELVPTLRELKETSHRELTDIDGILTSKRRTSPDSFRIYLDTSVNPHKLTVDSRFTVGGTFNTYAQIFRGNKIDNSGEVISTIYDEYGELLSTKINLELVNQSGFTNHCAKCVPPCYTTVNMPDDEIVTVVIYNDEGGVTSIQEFYVYNTAVIRQTDTSKKYIKDISIDSIYLSETDAYLLNIPLNTTIRGLNLFGVVHYSDGSTRRLPVDGSKFKILGMRENVATILGNESTFVLSYALDKNESAVGLSIVQPGSNPTVSNVNFNNYYITRSFKTKVVEQDGMYVVKLYGYPVWVDESTGYRMEWFMMNLERSLYKKVTPYVKYNRSNPMLPPFNGNLYGPKQRLSVSLDLKDAGITNKQYIHTQILDVILERKGTDQTGYHWSIGFDQTQDKFYGIDNWAKVKIIETDKKIIDIRQNENKLDDWLERMWLRTKPLYDPNREAGAPKPDMFKIVVDGYETEYRISEWKNNLEIANNLNEKSNVYIVFFKRMDDTDLFVGVSGLPVFIE